MVDVVVQCLYQATSGLHRRRWQQNILQVTEDLSCQASRQNQDCFSKLQVCSPVSLTLVEILTTVIICSSHFSFLKKSGTSCLHIQDQSPYELILNIQSPKLCLAQCQCKEDNSAESFQGFHMLMHEECKAPWIQLWARFAFWDYSPR